MFFVLFCFISDEQKAQSLPSQFTGTGVSFLSLFVFPFPSKNDHYYELGRVGSLTQGCYAHLIKLLAQPERRLLCVTNGRGRDSCFPKIWSGLDESNLLFGVLQAVSVTLHWWIFCSVTLSQHLVLAACVRTCMRLCAFPCIAVCPPSEVSAVEEIIFHILKYCSFLPGRQ